MIARDVRELVREHEGDLGLAVLVRELEDLAVDAHVVAPEEARRERVEDTARLHDVDRRHLRDAELPADLSRDAQHVGELALRHADPVAAQVPDRDPLRDRERRRPEQQVEDADDRDQQGEVDQSPTRRARARGTCVLSGSPGSGSMKYLRRSATASAQRRLAPAVLARRPVEESRAGGRTP